MERAFQVKRVALHQLDRQAPGPQLAEGEINLEAFGSEELAILGSFFSGHLEKAWAARESRRTVAANFKSTVMSQHYAGISKDANSFFEHSCALAKRLHKASKGVPASPGLLMVMWLRVSGDERAFLGLFKMDPGEARRIALEQDEAGNVLLKLAVERIQQALPDPRDPPLKWAVIPHPTRPSFDVKAKDEQASPDPALYFMDFLDCKAAASEKTQTESLVKAVTGYAEERHADEAWRPAVQDVLNALGALDKEPIITPDVAVETIKRSGAFRDFQEEAFIKKLKELKAEELRVSCARLRALKVEYRLDNGITIRGPRAVMENLVEIVPADGGSEFRVRTPGYKKSYV